MNQLSTPYISVIIVAYNYAQYLPRALEACRKQTWHDYELVIVNNGSTDHTQEIIDDFTKNNPQLTIRSVKIEKNQGLPHGRNVGIANAHGEYLFFNDADDWMDENCLKVLAQASAHGKYDRVCAQYRDVAPNNKILQIRNYPPDISRWYITMIQASLFRRSIFIENQIVVPKVFNDDYFIANSVNAYCKNFCVVQKTVYNYFVNELSTSGARAISDSNRIVKTLKECAAINHSIKPKLDITESQLLDYQFIKLYYFQLLHYSRHSSYRDIKMLYIKLHKTMLHYDAQYFKNRNITIFRNNHDRLYGKLLTYILCLSERTHTIKAVLWLYIKISKFYFFRV